MPNSDDHLGDDCQIITLRSTLVDAKKPECEIMRALDECGAYDEDAKFAIKLALEEAMTNAVRHGNNEDESKQIVVRYCISPERVIISVCDEGKGFCPEEIPDCTAPDRIALPSGRGIMLMKAYMSNVRYCSNGREVRMVKLNPRNQKKSRGANCK